VLDGKRLHGRFTLVRLKPRTRQHSRQDNWLLIKGHDEAEQRGADAPAIERGAGAGQPVSRAASLRPKVPSAASCRSGRRPSLPLSPMNRRKATTG
jgi:bifunctional non-homologous end joining protein LigD